MMMRIRSYLLITFLLASTSVHAAFNYTALFSLGDSLSDVGNSLLALGGQTGTPPYTDIIPSQPYPFGGGRFSNGRVWVEHLAQDLGLSLVPSLIPGGAGLAFGGARTGSLTGVTPNASPTLEQQAQLLIGALGTLSSDTLYVVWGGGNDVRDAGDKLALNDVPGALTIIAEAVANIDSTVTALHAAGAERFLIPNLPNLGFTPAVQLLGQAGIDGAAFLTSQFNSNLAGSIAALNADPNLTVQELDVFALVNGIFADPGTFGFSNLTAGCVLENSGLGCANSDEYFFWDGIHPTRAAYGILGDAAFAAVVPIPTPMILMLSALGGWCCIRRSTSAMPS